MPVGLPLFRGLVERVYQELGTTLRGPEQAEFNAGNYDRVLELLEDRFKPRDVRAEVRKALTTNSLALDTHKALLDLARDRDGALHLVTTNFDLLFEAAEPSCPVVAAPLLPVPKRSKWNSLVHLHGRLEAQDVDREHLVLTSADFGVAYLVERWASRFVAELFTNFTVLFIGYSADDPVMRYLVDALAAERRRSERFHEALALVPGEGDSNAPERWQGKRITPILYDPRADHAALHLTLQAWARIWKGGLDSKANLVEELANTDPETSPPDTISRLCWVVSDPSGAMAKQLARMRKRGSLKWLAYLEKKAS